MDRNQMSPFHQLPDWETPPSSAFFFLAVVKISTASVRSAVSPDAEQVAEAEFNVGSQLRELPVGVVESFPKGCSRGSGENLKADPKVVLGFKC